MINGLKHDCVQPNEVVYENPSPCNKTGGITILEKADADLMKLVLEVTSGKQIRTEEKGFREISIFKDGVVL